ncbi:unnamed protein product, partial [Prunus brigantina]
GLYYILYFRKEKTISIFFVGLRQFQFSLLVSEKRRAEQNTQRERESDKHREREREMGREVSESCVDSLLTEMVSMYCNRLYANKPELAASRIDAIGYQVGHQLSERYTMERPRFTDHLDAIKFICKDFWSELFKKQIDNLKTNHRGTFVLQDNRFRWVSRMSLDPSSENGDLSQENSEAADESKAAQEPNMHLHFSCGVIKGALHNLGIACAVSADTSQLPACGSSLIREQWITW